MNSDTRVFFIAEAGVNHGGDRDIAFAMVDAAAEAGADAVKFQTYDADLLAAPGSRKAAYQEADGANGESQHAMLKRLELPRGWHGPLKAHAQSRGIEFLSTAFDYGSLAFLLELGMPRLKVPSGELSNAPLLWQFGRSGLPLVISTGMSLLSDVELALAIVAHARHHTREPARMREVWQTWGNRELRESLRGTVTLLHCTSSYPAAPDDANLRAMGTMKQAFGLDVGYSDHTKGAAVTTAAVALGAKVVEKHFTLDASMPGPDQQASASVSELAELIRGIREVEQALGDGLKIPRESEMDVRQVARQRVVAARKIPAGASLVREDLTTRRTDHGAEAGQLWDMIGRRTQRELPSGIPVEPEMLFP